MARFWPFGKRRKKVQARGTAVTQKRRATGAEVDRQQLRRMKLMGGALGLGFLVVVGALLEFQGCNHELYLKQAEANYLRTLRMSTQRGDILDRNGEALASSVDVDTVYVNPKELREKLEADGKTVAEVARQVAHVLSMDVESVERAFNANGRFRYVKRQIVSEEADRIRRLDIPGLYIQQEAKRFYPKKEVAGQLLGVVGFDNIGVEGIESSYESTLRGGSVSTRYHRDRFGHYEMTEGLPDVATEAGHTLQLTIDEKIQAVAETELERAVVSYLGRSGMAVVMDVHTGDILAAAHYPRFNPNRYLEIVPTDTKAFQLQNEVLQDFRRRMRKGEVVDEEELNALRMHTMVPRHRNRVMSHTFEPGSTFKIFTLAAAIENGVVGLSDLIDTNGGRIKVDRKWVSDTHPLDRLATVTELVKYSSNVGFIKIGQMLGAELFRDAIMRFGFGQPAGVGVGGDAAGRVPALKEFGLVVSANVAFGQGLSVTALQLTTALAAIGNGGVLMKPRLVIEERAGDGTVVQHFEPEAVRRVVSPATCRTVLKALESVVEWDGTGHGAWLYDYDVAGKTGTAQKVDPIVGGYSAEHWTASFVGLVPSNNPRFAISVIIDEPKGLYYGGRVAAPAFRGIAEFALRYLEVPPTYGPRERVAREEVRRRHGQPDPTGVDLSAEGAFYDAPPGVSPALDPNLPKSVVVPDFTDLGVADAVRSAHKRYLAVQVDGTGLASAQSIPAGTRVAPWTTVTLYFRPGDDDPAEPPMDAPAVDPAAEGGVPGGAAGEPVPGDDDEIPGDLQ